MIKCYVIVFRMYNSKESPAKRLKIKEEKIKNSDEPPAKRLKIKQEEEENVNIEEDVLLVEEIIGSSRFSVMRVFFSMSSAE